MKYAMKDSSGFLISIFDADDLAGAVATKHRIQRPHNEHWHADEIFSVAEATPGDVSAMGAGFWEIQNFIHEVVVDQD
jgi:hypothetical protein